VNITAVTLIATLTLGVFTAAHRRGAAAWQGLPDWVPDRQQRQRALPSGVRASTS